MKFKDISTQSETEVRKLLEEMREQAHDLTLKMRLNQIKDTHKLKAVKRDIARILTHLQSLTK
jgi:large subunit ribosomal protein L29